MDDLVVTITGTSIRFGIPPYTEYEISVKVYIDKSYTVWKVTRRYSEFLELYEYLCLKYNTIREFPFPPKTRFRRYFNDIVNERKHLLSLFLQKCLDDQNIFKEVNFRKFLDFNGSFMNMELKSKNQDDASEEEVDVDEESELIKPKSLKLIESDDKVITQNNMSEDLKLDNTQHTMDDNYDQNKPKEITQTESNNQIEAISEYEFNATLDRELSLKSNQVVIITDSSNEEWYFGYIKDDPSKKGFFPKSYVKVIQN